MYRMNQVIPKIFRWLFFKKVIRMTTTDAIKNSNATLIDIREAYELETNGSIDHAINIPMSSIPEKIEELKQMQKPIVVFCGGGNRAASVMTFLKENGIEDCFNGGGFEDVKQILNS